MKISGGVLRLPTIDEIVARWQAGRYPPRPPGSRTAREVLFADVRRRCGFDPPADYKRFLELCDGGQNDAVWLFGAGAATKSHFDPTEDFFIGNSGNVDIYVLRPDGRAETVDMGATHVFDRYPSFRVMLNALIRY